jgi:hypothetical protein
LGTALPRIQYATSDPADSRASNRSALLEVHVAAARTASLTQQRVLEKDLPHIQRGTPQLKIEHPKEALGQLHDGETSTVSVNLCRTSCPSAQTLNDLACTSQIRVLGRQNAGQRTNEAAKTRGFAGWQPREDLILPTRSKALSLHGISA